MTIGYVLLAIGAIETIWSVWRIRTYDPNRVSKIEAAFTRTPKTKFGILIERSSYWYGLVMGLVLMSLGLILANME